MKKRIAMLMCAVAMTMTACGSTEVQDAEVVAEGEAAVEAAENGEAAVEAEAAEEVEAVEETIEYAAGVYTETGYDAEWFGYRFTTPEGCTLATQEQLMELLGVSVDLASGDMNKALLELAKQSMVLDLNATYEATGSNMNIAVQNTPTTGFTLEQLVDASAAQLESLDAMSSTVSEEREMVEIAGREYMKLSAVTEMQGVSMNQDLYTTMVEDYIVVITITTMGGNEAEGEALLAGLSEL